MATSSSTSSSTSSALTEVVAQPRIETRRTISSYDLTSGDNPGTLISKLLLLGPNYDEWANNLKLALKARKKFGFVDGTIPQPTEDDVDFEDWTANNTLVISWIRLTIDDSLSSSLSHVNDSNELWIHIQKRFGVKNGQRVQRHKTELANCRQKGLAIEAYYGKLTQLWGSLADYQRAKKMEEVRKEREEDKLHQFLMGLDDTLYGAVKSNLLSRIPLPSLEEAYNALTMDEEAKQLSQDNEGRADGVSFAVQTTPSRKPFDNRAVCNICGRTRHIADNCFRKIGYPEWWGENPKSNSNFRNKQGNNSGKGNSNYGGAGRATLLISAIVGSKDREVDRFAARLLPKRSSSVLVKSSISPAVASSVAASSFFPSILGSRLKQTFWNKVLSTLPLMAAMEFSTLLLHFFMMSKTHRVVVTSSMAAVGYNRKPRTPDVTVDETWFSDPELCESSKMWYVLSKTLAEDAAWKLAKEKGLDIVTINPTMVIGPLLQPTLNTSAAAIL
ncbi:Retrotransposon Copia-like N-terminal [Arabidopsis suecica]|uniref:Retrotransposon Copia-like N-terminal n=1 Tax=Arabidopsis suecica TaxID=45249 RepID=A0A8T2BJN7_ARASU|nr:Retrotransposon Copia-like N-terminal [Arabidopsis suecica]